MKGRLFGWLGDHLHALGWQRRIEWLHRWGWAAFVTSGPCPHDRNGLYLRQGQVYQLLGFSGALERINSGKARCATPLCDWQLFAQPPGTYKCGDRARWRSGRAVRQVGFSALFCDAHKPSAGCERLPFTPGVNA